MVVSCRMGTLSKGGIQGNSKWEDYYHPPISSQVLAKCLYCGKTTRTCKKKLANRTCQYCFKEFCYPSILKHHLRLKNMCSKQASQTTDQISLASERVSPTSDQVNLASNQISDQFNEKNMVPIRLLLA
ncbi:hypothetical protein RclHR1_27610001 [Rhizophagus clarus]|uniref:Uncharacterized protein n=1 Tax=Rhizophagus clarus TaxID=94130 RepID=A0A2Z6R2V7_9GLOM|nr:hypothetical protein RclHR1_27610001 [Rhizophagus clarus]GES95154.1 hypothetical protein RCL_e12167_RclHR1_27610001 [Rhizophagus clarus]